MHVTDWDDAYDNFGHIPEAAAYPPRWGERASAFRETLLAENRARLDIPVQIIEMVRAQLAADELWLRRLVQRWMNHVHLNQLLEEHDAMPAASASVMCSEG